MNPISIYSPLRILLQSSIVVSPSHQIGLSYLEFRQKLSSRLPTRSLPGVIDTPTVRMEGDEYTTRPLPFYLLEVNSPYFSLLTEVSSGHLYEFLISIFPPRMLQTLPLCHLSVVTCKSIVFKLVWENPFVFEVKGGGGYRTKVHVCLIKLTTSNFLLRSIFLDRHNLNTFYHVISVSYTRHKPPVKVLKLICSTEILNW